MRFVCIIEARLRSTRLPGKVLKPILGKPMLELMVERLGRARTVDEIVLATTDRPYDDPLVAFAQEAGLRFHRGSEDDVLLRVLDAARANAADVIVEVTGDCPLLDGALIDKVVGDYRLGGADFVSNVRGYTTPRGTDVRVFSTDALDQINRTSNDPADHEHVSLHFWEHPEKYRLRNVETQFPPAVADMRLTVDTQEDFELIRRIYEGLYPKNPAFSLTDVIEFLNRCPEFLAINNHVQQKAVR